MAREHSSLALCAKVAKWLLIGTRPSHHSISTLTHPLRSAKGAGLRRSGQQLTPLGQGGRAVLFEDVAAVEVTVVLEVVVD